MSSLVHKAIGVAVLFLASGVPPVPLEAGEPLEEYPYPGLPWAERAERIEQEIWQTHVYEGHIVPDILLPPDGHPDRISGNHEDGLNCTGPFLAALSYKYAVTRHPADRERARQIALGLEKLEQVTGVPGCLARSFYRSEQPVGFIERFFFPAEWHWSSVRPATRWLGDPSSDSLTSFLHGAAVYFDLAADESERRRIAALVDRVMGRLVAHNMRLTDVDGKMTLWGDYCPDSEAQNLNCLLALSHLKVAHHITGKGVYDRAYRRLISVHGYHERAIRARDLYGPNVEAAPWDNDLGLTGLYFLLRYETDRRLLGFYRASLERFREYLRQRHVHEHDLRLGVLASDTPQVTAATYEYMAGWNQARRRRDTRGTWQSSGHDYVHLYWLGRYYGLIGPRAAGAATAGEEALPRLDRMVGPPWVEHGVKCPPGMTYVPGGEFLMGCETGDDDESPVHRVHVDPFFIDITEVTNRQWKGVFPDHGFEPADADKPVTGMSWEEADRFARAIGKRLPTEAEWEKAARGTDGRLYPWGNFWDETMVAPGELSPVGRCPWGRSPYGCLDMAGNAWEWTASWYEPYPGNRIAGEAYGRKYKVIRGGADFASFSFNRTTHRYYVAPNTRNYGYAIGLRCATDAPRPSPGTQPGAGSGREP